MTSKYLKEAFQATRNAFIFIGIFSFFVNILMLTVPIYMLQLFDRVLASHSFDTLLYLTIIALSALLVLALLDIARSRVVVRISTWLDNKLSPAALGRSADEILLGRQYGSQSLRDISTIRSFLGSPGLFAIFDSPWVPVYLTVIFFMHPTLGILATIGAIILFCLALLNELLTTKPLAEANGLALQSQLYTDASIRNAEVIQAMGMMPNIVSSWFEKNKLVLKLQSIASNRSSAILSMSKFIRLSLQLLMLGIGAFFVVKNEITPGVMIAASILMSRALAPVEQAIGAWKSMQAARQAHTRLIEHFARDVERTSGIQLPVPKGMLNVEGVYYVPPTGGPPVINNISFNLPPQSILAIIGPSAAGKSSLARLIVGAWRPSAGNVRLDGADVYTWDRSDFGKYTGYLPQDIELFHGTIKENIARMGEIDDQAVIEAAQIAGVHDMILHMPHGYDTEIQGGQYALSGGQRQRIALARALYGNPKLLVLDEPNSNLDNDGEQALVQALLTMREKGSTIIVIAHRPVVVRHVDEILVLNNGRIQFGGKREEVLAKLQELAKSQSPATNIQKNVG